MKIMKFYIKKNVKEKKKVVIDFINKYNQKYSVLYFHEKNLKFVVKINELNWMTVEDLINKNLAVRRLK